MHRFFTPLILTILNFHAVAQDNSNWKLKVDDALKGFEIDQGPGGVVAIVQNNELLYTKSFGFADVETQTPIDRQTFFDIASCVKQFTAYGVLALDHIDLNDPIQKYIPDLNISDPVPVRSLLTHSSGLHDYSELMILAKGRKHLNDYSGKDILKIVKNQDSQSFKSLTDENYSNTNFLLLAQIIEAVSGMSYEEYMLENLIPGLGLNPDNYSFVDKEDQLYAKGYFKRESDKALFESPERNTSEPIYGAGGMYANITGLIDWMNLYDSTINNKLFINQLLVKDTLTDKTLSHYARGVEYGTTDSGHRWIQHTGRSESTSILLWLPDFDLSIIGLFNTQEIWAQSVSNSFLKSMLEAFEAQEIQLDFMQQPESTESKGDVPNIEISTNLKINESLIMKFTGIYPAEAPVGRKTPPEGGVGIDQIIFEDDSFFFVLYNGYKLKLNVVNHTVLEFEGVGREVRLIFKEKDGNIGYTVYDEYANIYDEKDITYKITTPSFPEDILGKYSNPTLIKSVPLEILSKDDDFYFKWGVEGKMEKIQYLKDDLYTVWSGDMQCNLRVMRANDGTVTGFRYDGHRVWDYPFYKE